MKPAPLLIFDDGLGDFGPLTDLRPAFDMRTGIFTARQRIEMALNRKAKGLHVQPELEALTVATNRGASINNLGKDPWLAVNGRVRATNYFNVIRGLAPGEAMIQADGQLVAACAAGPLLAKLLEPGGAFTTAGLKIIEFEEPLLLDRPWHILDDLEQAMAMDLKLLKRAGQFVRRSPKAKIGKGVVKDTSRGPVIVDSGATIGANSVLEGPCYIGQGTVVQPLSFIRSHTVIGPHCKVAGEISFTIILEYSNKAHAGYLGHALVGGFVNLGAETCVSNLKNTYGQVRMQLHAGQRPQDTGRLFCGPIIGDFVRTAIGTRVPTGACISTGAMIALSGFAPKFARPLGYYTDDAPHGAPAQMEKFLATARTMMRRRQVEMSPELEARLRALAAV